MFDQINTIELAPWIVDALGYITNAAALLLPLLVLAVLTFYGGEKAVKRGRLLLLAFRTLVDEPNDVIIQWYAKQIGVDPKELSDEVKEQIDNILKNIPAREMIIDIEPKEAKPLANRG